MNYLNVENLSKSYGENLLFENVSFGIEKGQKVALIAKNGTGKTTLLNILMGLDTADSGKYTLRGDIKVAYLPQVFDTAANISVLDAVFNSDNGQVRAIKEYEKALQQCNDADTEEGRQRLQSAIEAMDAFEAWNFESKAKEILHKLDLEDYFKHMNELSGGQRKKVALAKILLSQADFLIMDEPTNHLDIDMIEWLEAYLTTANTTLLMVTHDRFFLDKVCDEIIELDASGVYRYKGKYNYFLEKKQERLSNQAAEMEKLRNIYRKELEWMRSTPQARSTKAKARIDNFAALKRQLAVPMAEKDNDFSVKTERVGNKILEIDNLDFSYGPTPIVSDFSYIFKKGERCGVIGRNGSGKTTLLRLIVNELKPDAGKITFGSTIVTGYYSQDELNSENDGKRVIDIVKEHAEMVRMSGGNLISAPVFLKHFGFGYDLQYNYYEKLSGGQRRKLHLLLVLLKNPNFLILDEPTNDFDIDTLNLLEDFLLHFEGCLLIVSHDRWFMDKLVDHVFIMDKGGKIKDYYGNYTDYKSQRQKEERNIAKQQKNEKTSPIRHKAPAVDTNRRTYKEEQEFLLLEKEIEELELLQKQLVEQLASAGISPQESLRLSQEYADNERILDTKTVRWLELSEKMPK
ncbi:MAG: ABC-F family ATP-binding cassette domain-containing protein [Bacteroidales bacterium]|nr:ABC-F family ATP-binding cassette domain-containing protein [Bacteroidales bacterium]